MQLPARRCHYKRSRISCDSRQCNEDDDAEANRDLTQSIVAKPFEFTDALRIEPPAANNLLAHQFTGLRIANAKLMANLRRVLILPGLGKFANALRADG